jgi:YVTN family beta-propeller protein
VFYPNRCKQEGRIAFLNHSSRAPGIHPPDRQKIIAETFLRSSLTDLLRGMALALLSAMALTACSPQGGDTESDSGSPAVTPETDMASSGPGNEASGPDRISREGVVVEFFTRPSSDASDRVVAADWVDVTFRLTDASTGEPIKGRYPAAWMDLAEAWEAKGEKPMSCRDRVSTYLKGIVGVRPMIDLNSHFLLVLNRDASISVIDPAVGITGVTNLFAQINLDRPGADWAKTGDQKRLFVSMPTADMVALVDTETFEVVNEIQAGYNPTRAVLQGDERYLWIGNNSPEAADSGVTVIDTDTLKKVEFIPTGSGHHEIAFTDDDRLAFVSNRDAGTVSVIDVQSLKKVADIETGPVPISLAFSPLGGALYVADGKAGTVTVVDPDRLEVRARIEAQPGLGPMRFSEDGRWGVVVNPADSNVYVIDASTDRLAHTIPVGTQPYQVSFTRLYAYIRSLGTEQVGLISLPELDRKAKPQVKYFPAGQGAPGAAADISIASSMVRSVKEAASYIVNQAEGTVYYYMEGMTAPMGAFRNYGHEARAIEIVDRSLGEQSPGVYTGRVKLPVPGSYDVAFMMDTPRFLHCFSAKVEPNPEIRQTMAPLAVEFKVADRRVAVGTSSTVKLRLTDPMTGLPRSDIADLTLLYYRSDGRGRTVVPARALGDGFYEADVKVDMTTTYYVFVGSRSEKLKYNALPYLSLMGAPAPPAGGEQEAPQASAEGSS